jgi:hypothetical protein
LETVNFPGMKKGMCTIGKLSHDKRPLFTCGNISMINRKIEDQVRNGKVLFRFGDGSQYRNRFGFFSVCRLSY